MQSLSLFHSFTMAQRVKNHLSELCVLAKCPPKQRKAYLQHATKELITCLSECCANALKGHVPLSTSQKKALSRHKKHIREVANKRNSHRKRKDTLIQKGGFLGSLLGPILSLFMK